MNRSDQSSIEPTSELVGSPLLQEIQVTPSATERSSHGRVSFDTHFLGTPYCRKVYVGNDENFVLSSTPHFHDSVHYFYCLFGKGMRLATEDSLGDISIQVMEPATWYYIPKSVPHQVEMLGIGCLESYSEKQVFRDAMIADATGGRFPITPLEYDLFEQYEAGKGPL